MSSSFQRPTVGLAPFSHAVVVGADLDYITTICEEPNGAGVPTFPRHMPVMDSLRHTLALVIVDAWIDTVAGAQIKDPQNARAAMQPWADYATRTGAAVILVTHANRVDTPDIRLRYGLSGALRQVARTIFAVDPVSKALVVGIDKINVGSARIAHRFIKAPIPFFEGVVLAADGHDGTVRVLESLGDESKTTREIVADMHADRQQASQAPRQAKGYEVDQWLHKELGHGQGCRRLTSRTPPGKWGSQTRLSPTHVPG